MVAILSPQEALSHAPVLTEEVIEHLAVQPGGRYVDCTTGAGGHARAILEASAPGGLLLAEHAWNQGRRLREVAHATFPQAAVETKRDLAGKERVLVVETP